MNRFFRHMVTAGAVAALLVCGSVAMAAETPEIQVQLDGQNLTFTDAVPQVKDQRTFLPFRAVFEAMGAEVSNEGSVITAVRDGRTLTMTLNETTATLTEGEVTTSIVMDVAPYVDNTTWRTYVPVRFAAQAFGCAVGWDQAAYTAIIVDVDPLVDMALEGKEFTYLEKLAAYSEKYSQGIWDMDMTMDGSITMLGAEMPAVVTVNGIVDGETKAEMDMNMTMDMSQLMALGQQMGGGAELTAEDQAMLDSLKNDGIDLSMRGDLSEGIFYMNMKGDLLASAGMDTDAWFSMDMNAMMAQSGINMTFAELMQASKDIDFASSITRAFLSTMTPVSADAEGYGVSYQTFKDSAENLAAALSDQGFQKDGKVYTASIDGGLNKMELSLTMEKDAVTAYDMLVNMTISDQETVVTMLVDVGMDEKDQMTGKLAMDMAPMMSMELNITGGYKKGTKAPQTEPPAGATVVDMNDPEGMNAALGIMPLE